MVQPVAQHEFPDVEVAGRRYQPCQPDLLAGAEDRFGLLTESLQVRGAIALDYISRAGVQVDLIQVEQVREQIAQVVAAQGELLEQLARDLGEPELFQRRGKKKGPVNGPYLFRLDHARQELRRTASGVPRKQSKAVKRILERIGQELGLRPRRNKDGLVTDSVAYWSQRAEDHPFLACYCTWSAQGKLAQFFSKLGAERIHPRYVPLVRTGRSSCRQPNLQQLPRASQFREMIVAAPGQWLLAIDYSTLELRTLAQICLRRFGRSKLAEVFAAGGDPHSYTAAILQQLSVEQFQALPQEERKTARQRAKAVNFGTPGGLGAPALMAYAKTAYGVEMSLDEAKKLRRRLITEVYPELRLYLAENRCRILAANMLAPVDAVAAAMPDRNLFDIALNIIGNAAAVEEYGQEKCDFMWSHLQRLNSSPDLAPLLEKREPSELLARRLFFGHAATLSGRVRGHVRFTARCNAPFQGLAADGAKLALFELVRAGYRVFGCIHDEVLIEIPKSWDLNKAYEHVEQILCYAMRQMTPDIPIACEGLLADRWYKGVDANQRDAQGRLVPYIGKRQG